MSSSPQVVTNQIVTITADYVCQGFESIVAVTDMSAPRNVTLPIPSNAGPISNLIVKDQTGLASPGNRITVSAPGSTTIDGAPFIQIQTGYGVVVAYSDGKNWFTRSEAITSAVATVTGSAPITSSGGANPNIGIDPATDLAPGSMSAADKTKLDSITAGAAVASVSGTAPITSSGGLTPSIGITNATDLTAGAMSAADKTKLDGMAQSNILWQPGASSSDVRVATFAECVTAIANARGMVNIWASSALAALATGNQGSVDGQGRARILSAINEPVNSTFLNIEDGTTLKDFYEFVGTLFLNCKSVTTKSFDWTQSVGATRRTRFTQMDRNAGGIAVDASALVSPIQLPANSSLDLHLQGAMFFNNSAPSVPVIDLGVSGALTLYLENNGRMRTTNLVSGSGTSSIIFFGDDESRFTDFAAPYAGAAVQYNALNYPNGIPVTADYTQPNVGNNVTVDIAVGPFGQGVSGISFVVGQKVWIPNGGGYTIASFPSSSSVSLTSLGTLGAAAPSTNIGHNSTNFIRMLPGTA
jgi:hypothetical protein